MLHLYLASYLDLICSYWICVIGGFTFIISFVTTIMLRNIETIFSVYYPPPHPPPPPHEYDYDYYYYHYDIIMIINTKQISFPNHKFYSDHGGVPNVILSF